MVLPLPNPTPPPRSDCSGRIQLQRGRNFIAKPSLPIDASTTKSGLVDKIDPWFNQFVGDGISNRDARAFRRWIDALKKYIGGIPGSGLAARFSQSFPEGAGESWRVDLEILVGTCLKN